MDLQMPPRYDHRKWLEGRGCLLSEPWYAYGDAARYDPAFRPPVEPRPITFRRKSDAELEALIRGKICGNISQVYRDRYEAKEELDARSNIRLARRHLRECSVDPLSAPGRVPQPTLWPLHPTLWRRRNRLNTSKDRRLLARAAWFLGQHRLNHRLLKHPEPAPWETASLTSLLLSISFSRCTWSPYDEHLQNPTPRQLRRVWELLVEARKTEGSEAVRMIYTHFLG